FLRNGALRCVMGCGGDRDQAKRPQMGAIAQRHADSVVITNDNPRSEDPEAIAQAILDGAHDEIQAQTDHAGIAPVIQLSRATAILDTVWQANPNDIILIAGKGHETYQEIGNARHYFSDVQWAQLALTWLYAPQLSTDTRSLQAGELFLAISGDRFDGHDFLDQAEQKKALAAIVARPSPDVELPQIVVGPTLSALQKMADSWRKCFQLPVVAVTGSNGKTTTKEMIARIFAAQYGDGGYLATQGNLNNHIGVPLSILCLNSQHRVAVFELGMNQPNEIAALAALARPQVALVNNAQREHQEFMHTVKAVAQENGSVLEALPEDGVAVFPADDDYSNLWSGLAAGRKCVTFSLKQGADVSAREIY